MRVIAFSLIAFISLQSPSIGKKQQTPSKNQSNIPDTRPASTETPPVVNNVYSTPKESKPEEQSKKWPPPPPWDIYWPTLALTIATAIAVGYAIKTLGAIREQVTEMRKAGGDTERLVKEAIAQSTAATKSADALINSERAWVLAELVPAQASLYDYELRISNVGRTPGIITGYSFAADAIPAGSATLPPLSFFGRKNVGLILADKQVPVTLDHFAISAYLEEHWQDITAGQKTGIFAISVEYTDVFDRDQEHRTFMVYSWKQSASALTNVFWENKYT